MPNVPRSARLPVPIIRGQTQRSWPKHVDARPVAYHTLTTVLTTPYPYDAHMAAYSAPTWPYRLSSGALDPEARGRLPDGVAMVLAAFDIDCPSSHRATGGSGEAAASEAWWQAELRKVEALAQTHPPPYAYRSRGGYRLIYRLPEPYLLRDPTERKVWSACYLAWCAYLAWGVDIHADPSCQDWTRLYRLPHATREEGGRPEEWPTLGDPRRIGVWAPEIMPEDMAMAQTLARRKSGAGHGATPHRLDRHEPRGRPGDPVPRLPRAGMAGT